MTVDKTGSGRSEYRSYKDATLANLPPDHNKSPPLNPKLWKLICSLKALLARYPEGVMLNQARRCCPLLQDPEVLRDHPSVRHLLLTMSSTVQLQGLGVQTRLLLAPKN